MIEAVCFNCGTSKGGPFIGCPACGKAPTIEPELTLSLVLSTYVTGTLQLKAHAREIIGRVRLTIPQSSFSQAREALKDPELRGMVRASPAGSAQTSDDSPASVKLITTAAPSTPTTPAPALRRFTETELHRNPFWLLGASTRDSRQRIVELADEKSLEIDPDVCAKARSDLTNPRTRLASEISWLPGVSPGRAAQVIQRLTDAPRSIRSEAGLAPLAHSNLLAAAFEALDAGDSSEEVSGWVLDLADLFDQIGVEDLVRDLNEDRMISKFPEIKSIDQVESEIEERKRVYRTAMRSALNRLPPKMLIEAMTRIVETATSDGEEHASQLIDSLVDSYEVDAQSFLQKEAENLKKLIEAARVAAKRGAEATRPIVGKIVDVARNWDWVAQPIQLCAQARGVEHELSSDIGYALRSLAVDLFNEHDMLDVAQGLTALLQELFSELPELADRINEDEEALDEIFQGRKRAQANQAKWAESITYQVEWGIIFKDRLAIAPAGITWKGETYPLNAVTAVYWGGIRNQYGVQYSISFKVKQGSYVRIEPPNETIYSTFVEKLWRAVCVRLMTEHLEFLKAGHEWNLGEGKVRDDGVTLTKHKLLGANQFVLLPWSDVKVWTDDGSFVIGSKADSSTYAKLSYLHAPNAHVLEHIIRIAFKNGVAKLSDILSDD